MTIENAKELQMSIAKEGLALRSKLAEEFSSYFRKSVVVVS